MSESTPSELKPIDNYIEKGGLRIYEVDGMHIMEFLESIPDGFRVASLSDCEKIPVKTPLVALDKQMVPKNPPFHHDSKLEDEPHLYIWGHSMASTAGVYGTPVSNSDVKGTLHIALKAV